MLAEGDADAVALNAPMRLLAMRYAPALDAALTALQNGPGIFWKCCKGSCTDGDDGKKPVLKMIHGFQKHTHILSYPFLLGW